MNEELLPVVLVVEALSPDMEEAFELGVKTAQKLGVHGVTFLHGDKDCYAYGRGDGTATIDGTTVGTFSPENGYVATQAYREAQEAEERAKYFAAGTANQHPYREHNAPEIEPQSTAQPWYLSNGWAVAFALAFAIAVLLGVNAWGERTAKQSEFGSARIEKELQVMNKAVEWARQFGVVATGIRCQWALCDVRTPEVCYQLDCYGESCRITAIFSQATK